MSSECWRLTSCILIAMSTQHDATSALGRGSPQNPSPLPSPPPLPTYTLLQVPGIMAPDEHGLRPTPDNCMQ